MPVLLLAPSPPLLFMGEEFGAKTPFLFFCDFTSELAEKVRNGRRAEFARFEQFRSPEAQAQIPDPNEPATFLASKLDWNCIGQEPYRGWLNFYRKLLKYRSEKIVPRIRDIKPGLAKYDVLGPGAVQVRWAFANGGSLELIGNLGREALVLRNKPQGKLVYATADNYDPASEQVPPHLAAWFLNA